jgi:glyoxylase-like metal-dependent hydrolase (beta-lactamase superfamily II)
MREETVSVAVARFSNAPYGSQTYVVTQDGHGTAVVIDPGSPDARAVANLLVLQHKKLECIILTHEHFDHIAGVNMLRQLCDCNLICSKECSSRIVDPKKNLSRYLARQDYTCCAADYTCEELHHRLNWGGLLIRFFDTPGHSAGSISVAIQDNLFTGDTLVFNTKTVVKLPGGNKQHLYESVHFILSHFHKNTLVHPGHGACFRLDEAQKEKILT